MIATKCTNLKNSAILQRKLLAAVGGIWFLKSLNMPYANKVKKRKKLKSSRIAHRSKQNVLWMQRCAFDNTSHTSMQKCQYHRKYIEQNAYPFRSYDETLHCVTIVLISDKSYARIPSISQCFIAHLLLFYFIFQLKSLDRHMNAKKTQKKRYFTIASFEQW